jgi:hypothetical protein
MSNTVVTAPDIASCISSGELGLVVMSCKLAEHVGKTGKDLQCEI